jgi:hypothetical protein
VTARADAQEAFRLVRQGQCNCGPSTGRHHAVLALLELLARDGEAAWSDVLSGGEASAIRFNRANGLQPQSPPAGTKFAAFGSYGWFLKYLVGGAPRGGRYSATGPPVQTSVDRSASGALIRLANSGGKR